MPFTLPAIFMCLSMIVAVELVDGLRTTRNPFLFAALCLALGFNLGSAGVNLHLWLST